MAHPKAPNQRKAYTAHFNRVERYAALVDAIYVESIKEFSKLAISVGDPSKPFQFSDYPHIKSKVAALQKEIAANIEGVIVNGITAEWNESNFKNNALARSMVGIDKFDLDDKSRDKIPARFKPYFNNNTDVLNSFIDRKNSGLGLSDRVWKLSEQYKSELELAFSVGLSDGRSAGELSRDVRQYLNEPNKLFRRVMQNDKLRLSKAAKAYHPGRGVYRSSYKNAMRLTRTEINAAYRTADSKRWQQMDFVVGFEVKRSGRGYDCSVCESLAGKYPKGFVFTGWHPHCRCYVIPILRTNDEFWAWDGRGQSSADSVNQVKQTPQGFKEWMETNRERMERATQNNTMPYFIKDNTKLIANYTHQNKKFKETLNQYSSNIKISNATLEATIMDMAQNFPGLFGKGLAKVKVVNVQIPYMMATHHGLRVLAINNYDLVTETEVFNPVKELKAALRTISKKERLSFNQEYAMESLWHEIRHLGALGQTVQRDLTPFEILTMETLNQFCARHSYDRFIKQLSGVAVNQKEILEAGYGYKTELTNFNNLLSKYNIDPHKTAKHFHNKIQETPYEQLYFLLNAFLTVNKVPNAMEIIGYLDQKENFFNELLKRNL